MSPRRATHLTLVQNQNSGEQKPKMNTPRRRPMRFLVSAAVALVGLAALPSLASALTITVDDDRAQCPLADETTLTAAVAAAANGDTVKVCAGTYTVPGGPAPSSGLRIEKNISIAGAGSDKVFVQPTQGSGSMAQAAPNPRDEYGNVITVRRRLIELTDVSISGLTVKPGNVPVEAGIAMIDVVTGSISSVKVEGIVPMSPTPPTPSVPLPGTGAFAPEIEGVPNPLSEYGHGIVVANTIEQTQNTTTITGSQISQFNATGILVDNRNVAGTVSVGNKSTVTANIVNTRVTGAGAASPIGQTGVEGWGSGAAVKITKSKIASVGKADGSAAAVEMHGVDLLNSVVGGSESDRNDLTANLYGATNVAFDGTEALSSLNATQNFWGTTVDAEPTPQPLVGPKVTVAPTATTTIPATTLAPIVDNLPTAQWDTKPAEGAVLAPGASVPLAAVAGDDFGVKTVEFKVNGGLVSTSPTPGLLEERVYTGSWTPTAAFSGANVISAVVTDSAGQTSQVTVNVQVEGKPHFTATPAITGLAGGYAAVGDPLTCTSGTAAAYPAPTYSYGWTVNGAPVATGTPTYTPVAADAGKKVVCTVTATNSFGSAGQASGQAQVAIEPALASAAAIGGAGASYAVLGEALTCTAGAASGDPIPDVTYAWTREGTGGAIATTSGYTVVSADLGKTLSCKVAATSATGEASSSASIDVGSAPKDGAPVLSGLATVGSTLTCQPGVWTALPEAAFAYTWLRGGAPIAGAVGDTYATVPADIGAAIACEVTASNELGSAKATATAIVVEPAPLPPAPPAAPVPPAAPASPAPPAKPSKAKGAGKVSGKVAPLAGLVCEVGPCAVTAPKTVKVKIGGKLYTLKVLVPSSLGSGEAAKVKVKLGKKAKAALIAAGKSAKFTLVVTIEGPGGASSKQLQLKLKAPAKR